MKVASPYLTARESCEYLRCKSMQAFYAYRYSRKLKAYRRGGLLLFKQADLDASLEEERPARGLRRSA